MNDQSTTPDSGTAAGLSVAAGSALALAIAQSISHELSDDLNATRIQRVIDAALESSLWAVKDPRGSLNYTTLDAREDWSIKRWMDQEQLVTRTLCGHPVPSWEGYEAQGYSVVRCGIIERT